MVADIAKGLPALIAVILGVALYVGYAPVWMLLVAVALGAVGAAVGRYLLRHDPVLANVLISLWILVGIGVMAAVSAGLLWLAMKLPKLFPSLSADQVKEVGAALMGALTTFIGVAFAKDMAEGKGIFWPAGVFKKFIVTVFSPSLVVPVRDTRTWDAVYEDRVRDKGPKAWGFRSRHARAKILEAHLADLRHRGVIP